MRIYARDAVRPEDTRGSRDAGFLFLVPSNPRMSPRSLQVAQALDAIALVPLIGLLCRLFLTI